jgi:hypothetical protein
LFKKIAHNVAQPILINISRKPALYKNVAQNFGRTSVKLPKEKQSPNLVTQIKKSFLTHSHHSEGKSGVGMYTQSIN